MLSELCEIEKKCFKEEAFSRQQISYLLSEYNAISLIARVDGEIEGFIIGRIDLVRNQPIGHIMTVDVAPNFRRKGIGTKLMLEIEAYFKQKDVKECLLEVREGNYAAQGLYIKIGYQKVAMLENYYGKINGLYLRKNLFL